MTFHHTSMSIGAERLSRCVRLALLPMLAPLGAVAMTIPQRPASPVPAISKTSSASRTRLAQTYLALLGPAPLHFAEPAPSPQPQPEPIVEPIAASTESPEPAPSASAEPAKTPAPSPSPADAPTAVATEPEPDLPGLSGPIVDAGKPVSILPDDTRREIRPEDVLPFFQFPGETAVLLSVPVPPAPQPGTLQPSSASYQQQ